jgi:hypothetical protein
VVVVAAVAEVLDRLLLFGSATCIILIIVIGLAYFYTETVTRSPI